LVLLTSLAFMAGVVTLARRQALLRELASVELLARADTLCPDKTGTITTGHIVMSGLGPLGGSAPEGLPAALPASDPEPNPALQAVAAGCGDPPPHRVRATVPFSSARKWSAAEVEGIGVDGSGPAEGVTTGVYLGAPEILLQGRHPEVAGRVAEQAAAGHRVVLLATSDRLFGDELPEGLTPRSLVLLADEIRADAPETREFFALQGV